MKLNVYFGEKKCGELFTTENRGIVHYGKQRNCSLRKTEELHSDMLCHLSMTKQNLI